MNLSEHFSLEEFTASETAERQGINNEPTPYIIQKLQDTARHMERVRSILDAPVHILSGYRSPELNAAVGGSKSSQHTKGEACDFIAPRFGSPLEICKLLQRNADVISFDQLIWEGTWVHISFAEVPRNQVLTWRRGEGYSEGLNERRVA